MFISRGCSDIESACQCRRHRRHGFIQSLGWDDPLEKEVAPYSSILAWRIPWTEEPGRLQSMGSQRVGHGWAHITSSVLISEDISPHAEDHRQVFTQVLHMHSYYSSQPATCEAVSPRSRWGYCGWAELSTWANLTRKQPSWRWTIRLGPWSMSSLLTSLVYN